MATAHYIAYKSGVNPSHCAAGKKGERMAMDVEKSGLDYVVREIKKENCPLCNPPKNGAKGAPPAGMPAADPIKPGQCHNCREGSFKLAFINHVLIRTCNTCGAKFDLEACKPLNLLPEG